LRNQVAFSHQIYEMTGQTNHSAGPNATKTLRAKQGLKKRKEIVDEKQKASIINQLESILTKKWRD